MKKYLLAAVALIALAAIASSCSDSKSYAELLQDENQAVNKFLVQHRVVDGLPPNNDFEVGEDAPYYRLDEDSNVYMQVLDKGSDQKPEKNDRVYFRFTRYSLFYYIVGDDEYNATIGSGNADNMNTQSTYFLFDNTSVSESTQYGTGIQLPLHYLGYGARVNIVIKSQAGPSSDMSYVVPYLYTISYNKSMI